MACRISDRVPDQAIYDCVRRHGPVTPQQVAVITGVNSRKALERLKAMPQLETLGTPMSVKAVKETGRLYNDKQPRFVVREES